MSLSRALHQVQEDLDAIGVSWALVGGLAVSARSEPRFTRDVDIVVAVQDDAAADSVVLALQARGYRAYASLDPLATGRLASERLWSPGDGEADRVSVDLLFASSGIEIEICESSERLEVLPGLRVPVASIAHLVVLKLLSRGPDRPRDDQDLMGLVRLLDASGVERAREAAAWIQQRGTARGRDLLAALDAQLGTTGRT